MIEVKNLRKIYKSKKFAVTALDGVSFVLPDKGLVFVVGKSGSGKSTLLNLLGGLDEATEGEIRVDGIDFSEMKSEKSFDGFRAQYLGFVFQDFHLVDRLTVAENVGFALELKGEMSDDKVREALVQVGLEDCEKRYPAELSGGQQQRVAIARALIKDPRLVLADEPTGNLDSVTSVQILENLKRLAQDRLVVVVSHSMENAREFADRIIELGDGRIVRDVTRTGEDEPVVKDGAILLGEGALSDGDIQKIDEAIKAGEVTAAKRASKFEDTSSLPSQKSEESGREMPVRLKKPVRLSFGRNAAMSFKFLRKGGLVASVIIAAFLIVLFVICMMLYGFDGGSVIRDAAVSDEYPVIFQQQNESVGAVGIKLDKLVKVEDGAEQAIRGAGYEGKIYRLVNMGVPTRGSTNLEDAKLLGGMEMYKDIYSAEGLGVLIADEEYLHKYFGDFEVLSGALDAEPYGIIITDYLADSMLFYDPTMTSQGEDPYAKLVKTDHFQRRIKINAVISTGYKQKYADLFEKYSEVAKDGIVTSAERNELTGSDMFVEFYKDAQSRLNIAYAIDPDYLRAVVDNPGPSKYFARLLNADVKVDGKTIYDDFGGYGICASAVEGIPVKLNRGEAFVSVDFYNRLFGTEFTAENIFDNFEEKSFSVREYPTDDVTRQQPLYEKTFIVKGIYSQTEYMFVSDEDFVEMRQFDVFAYALVLDDKNSIDSVMSVAEELDLMPNATLYSDLLLLTKVMNVYKDVFLSIALVLLGAGFLVLVSFAVKNVSGRTYEIGILRALGASEGQVMRIFVLQTLFAGALIFALEIAAQFALMALTNSLLTSSLAAFMHNGMFKGLTMLKYDPIVSLASLGAMAAITLGAAVFPLVKLSRIKPIEILRKKD